MIPYLEQINVWVDTPFLAVGLYNFSFTVSRSDSTARGNHTNMIQLDQAPQVPLE